MIVASSSSPCLVDDEITDREALKRLIPAQHSIVEAVDGKTCLNILKNLDHPNIIRLYELY